MNVSDIEKRIELIKGKANWDNESAHSEEDQLYYDVLKAIAAEPTPAAELAAAALKANEIEYDRWYA